MDYGTLFLNLDLHSAGNWYLDVSPGELLAYKKPGQDQ